CPVGTAVRGKERQNKRVVNRVADYRLRNVGELQRDFQCGRGRDALRCAGAAPTGASGRQGQAVARRCLGSDKGGVVIALGDRRQTAEHLSPMLPSVVAAPYFTGSRRSEEGEGFAPVLQTHGLKGCLEPVREAVTHCLPGSPAVGAFGDAGASIMLLI